MENNKRRCYSCRHYARYYTKQITFFDRLDYGACSVTGEKLQEKFGTCEHWSGKSRRSLRQLKAASEALCRAADSICMIQQVLCEPEDAE